jgi:LPS sulfotransferase NodH
MLLATGGAGRPLEHFEYLRHSSLPRQPREYFLDRPDSRAVEHLAPAQLGQPSDESPQDWWQRILTEGSTDNGVWAGKIMWGHVEDFLSRARELPGLAGADLHSVLTELLDSPRLVFVTRPDKVAQAVSLWRAVQTQAWRDDGDGSPGAAVYDFDGIDHLVEQLEAHDAAWLEWFEATGQRPIEASYAQMDQAPVETVAGVLEALGLSRLEAPDPHLSRQRDDVSLAWAERYRRDRTQAA